MRRDNEREGRKENQARKPIQAESNEELITNACRHCPPSSDLEKTVDWNIPDEKDYATATLAMSRGCLYKTEKETQNRDKDKNGDRVTNGAEAESPIRSTLWWSRLSR